MSLQNLKKLLIEVGGLDEKDFVKIAKKAQADKISMMHAMELTDILDESRILDLFSKYYGVPKTKVDELDVPPGIIALLPKDLATQFRVIPIDRVGNNIIIASADPTNLAIMDAIRFRSGYFPKPVLASEIKITDCLKKYYLNVVDIGTADQAGDNANKRKNNAQVRKEIENGESGDGPVIKFINDILVQCLKRGASDIHIEPYEETMRVRLRIDGALYLVAQPPKTMMAALVSRVKIMASLNIAESRLPQDGAINVQIGGRPVDFRVNVLPTVYGEKIVMRILDKSALKVDMTQLGFEEDELKKFKDSTHSPFGMVLVTGPTGSGKTTTLYSALADLNKETENIMTAEDPVEYNLPGINQVQMKPDIKLNFAAALRAFLRQDPDIIMVGEIRDLETAEIAIKAALTGHLVISTLHTNGAAETLSRLLNMGVESFNLVSALNCVTAQRLVRKICEKCKMIDESVTPEAMVHLGLPLHIAQKTRAYIGKGCSTCNGTGTKGRIAVHEVLKMDETIRQAIVKGLPAMEIKKLAMSLGMRSLRQSALVKMVRGITSAVEVVKATAPDDSELDVETAA